MKRLIGYGLLCICLLSCEKESDDGSINEEYRQKMRQFVIHISQYCKSQNSDFKIIPQNGIELISNNGEANGQINTAYLNAIDGHGQEDLFYGYNNDNEKSPFNETNYLLAFLNKSKSQGKQILVTDYCSDTAKVNESYQINNQKGFISFAANKRELDEIPNYPSPIHNENSADIRNLNDAKNFLYLINFDKYTLKSNLINDLKNTNYDILLMDLFFNDGSAFSTTEINQLKIKKNGGKRLVICYMSIGEAENYRYYWQQNWVSNPPEWLLKENPNWAGNYKVQYWNPEWQKVIYGNNNSYCSKILAAGFDGVYLDIIDGFEYFE